MLETLVSFAGIAVLVSLTPGPATALVVRSAALHGRREAMLVTFGNSTGIFMWALASVLVWLLPVWSWPPRFQSAWA